LEENHDLRGADGPRARHRDGADDSPTLGRVAVERLLEGLRAELAAPPAVLLRQHFVFPGLSTSSTLVCRKPNGSTTMGTYPSKELNSARPAKCSHGGINKTPMPGLRAILQAWSGPHR